MRALFVVIAVLLAVLAVLVIAYFLYGRGEARFTFDIGGGAPRAAGGGDDSSDAGFKASLRGLRVFSGAIFAALIARLWSMQLISGDDYAAQAERNRTRTISISAPRGRILDRNGVELVTNRPSLTVVADADIVDDPIKVRLLANLIGMPYMAARRNIQDATEGAQSRRTVAVDVSRRVVAFIDEHPSIFDGVEVVQKTQRHYPGGTLAAHVLGYVGTITEDQLKKNQKDSSQAAIAYESGDTVGQAGIEYQYEDVLQGVRGEQEVYVDADGNVLSFAGSVEPQQGSDIVLTLDSKVQAAAEKSLANIIKKRREEAGCDECYGGSAVCMDVTNGEIIAMASEPTFSPNLFVGGISSDDWDELSSEDSYNPLMNRVVTGQYPSASTIKPLSTFAALDYGIATASSSYYCSGYWTGFGKDYGKYCWKHSGHGTMTLQTGITYSCDVVFYEVGKGFFYSNSPFGLQETYRKWGLGEKTGIDLPGEAKGRVPDAEWKWKYYSSSDDDARSWKGGDDANLVIGQGDLLVTPLQMLCAYAGIATGGKIHTPHLLKSVNASVGSGSVVEYKDSISHEIDEKQDYLDLARAGLKGVIYEESAAQASHFTNMSETVAGKTGTAETSHDEPTGWFICYAPYEDPKYVVAACVENGGYGSEAAMYVARDILGAIYDEPDTSTAVDNSGVR